MSRIGKIPVPVPSGVQLQLESGAVKAKGPLGELQERLPSSVAAKLDGGKLVLFMRGEPTREIKMLYGTSRARMANMIHGVHQGFTKVLEVVGLGYKAQLSGEKLVLNLGRSHPVELAVPKGVKISVDPKQTQLTVSGCSKDLVGATAAAIRALRPPEPYKGTGIRYAGEHIRRKAGKTAAGVGAGTGGGGGKK